MRFFITGIGGFVGPHLTRLLLASGDEVSGTYLGTRPPLAGVEMEEVDLLDAGALTRALRRANPEAIVHLAGLSHVGESWQRIGEYYRANFAGTENLLGAAAGTRTVIASTAEVYGPVPEAEQPLSEERTADPRTPYALTKAASERLALPRGAIVARTFNLIGPGQAGNFALPAFAAQLRAVAGGAREAVVRVGNLSARRDFLHVADGAAALRCLALEGRRGEIYNVASGQAHSIAEMLDRLLAVSGVKAEVQPDPERMRPVDLPLLCGDASRLRALGWEPRWSVDRALADLWASTAA